jgi:hypothetical protein
VSGATAVAASFVADFGGKHYDSAESLLSDTAKQQFNATALSDDMSELTRRLGPWVRPDEDDVQVRSFGELQTCKVTYTLAFTNGSCQMTLLLVQTDKTWLIDSITLG